MHNPHRGEVSVMLAGEQHRLRLTLQALAEIESAFGASDLQDLGDRLANGRFRAQDLVALLGATLRGGGGILSDGDIAQRVDAEALPAVMNALAEVFARSFGRDPGVR